MRPGLTSACSLTAARLRFLLKPNGHDGAAAAEAGVRSVNGLHR